MTPTRTTADLGDRVATEAHPSGLPLFVEARDGELAADPAAARAWSHDHHDALGAALVEHGAVVLRGFAVRETADFAAMMARHPRLASGYTGGTSGRHAVEGDVFEATRQPPEQRITLHNEMSYLPTYPSKVAFFCKVAPATGGETILGDTRRLMPTLPAGLVAGVRERGVLYRRNLRSEERVPDGDLARFHASWQHSFGTGDRADVEAACAAMGLGCEWLADGSASITYRAPGFVTHPATGEELWFNHVVGLSFGRAQLGDEHYEAQEAFYGASDMSRPYEVAYGDGSPLDEAEVAEAQARTDEVVVAFPWRAGDLMVVDNLLASHGRNPYTGDRDVQVMLVA